MLLTVAIIMGVYSAFTASAETESADVSAKLIEIETILINMVSQMIDVKERLENLENEKESTTSCPDRWVAYKGSCYYFGSTSVTFSAAQDICSFLGAHLVHVEKSIENVFLKDFMRSHSKNIFWVGVTDLAKEGVWKLTGKNVVAPFLDWGNSEPNGRTGENCVVFSPGHQYRWVDVPCPDAYRYLCERN